MPASGEFPSVLATLNSDTDVTAANDARFGIGQLFATGSAAAELAQDESVRRTFDERNQSALDEYRGQERNQSRHTIVTLSGLAAVADADLPKVWMNVAALGMFPPDAGVEGFVALDAHSARDK